MLETIAAINPKKILLGIDTNPAAGVIATKPTTAPIHAPKAEAYLPLILSKNTQVNIADADATVVVAKAIAAAQFAAPAKINTIDGLRVDWPDGFGLIRASNTTPVLVLRFEGHTTQALHRIEQEMLELLKSVMPNATIETAAH